MTHMYGPAVRCMIAELAGRDLHHGIRPLIGACGARGYYIYERWISLAEGLKGHLGHQCSHARGRQNLIDLKVWGGGDGQKKVERIIRIGRKCCPPIIVTGNEKTEFCERFFLGFWV